MIELKEVSKAYNKKNVFEDVSLKLEEGKVTAIVGHNGCGKSTLLKVISGLVTRDSGEIIYERNYRFAYVPEKFPAISMSARAYLEYMSRIDGRLQKSEIEDRLCALTKDFFVESMLDKPMKHLSKGTLQKIGVIQALMSQPDVLLLDEPLSGQDADSREVFVEKVRDLKKEGSIILLAAHEPDLIHDLGDKVYTIDECKLLEYEIKPRTKYVINLPQDKNMTLISVLLNKEQETQISELQKTEKGYCIVTEEQMLYLEIKRLQREGWHIGYIYETDTHDEI